MIPVAAGPLPSIATHVELKSNKVKISMPMHVLRTKCSWEYSPIHVASTILDMAFCLCCKLASMFDRVARGGHHPGASRASCHGELAGTSTECLRMEDGFDEAGGETASI